MYGKLKVVLIVLLVCVCFLNAHLSFNFFNWWIIKAKTYTKTNILFTLFDSNVITDWHYRACNGCRFQLVKYKHRFFWNNSSQLFTIIYKNPLFFTQTWLKWTQKQKLIWYCFPQLNKVRWNLGLKQPRRLRTNWNICEIFTWV